MPHESPITTRRPRSRSCEPSIITSTSISGAPARRGATGRTRPTRRDMTPVAARVAAGDADEQTPLVTPRVTTTRTRRGYHGVLTLSSLGALVLTAAAVKTHIWVGFPSSLGAFDTVARQCPPERTASAGCVNDDLVTCTAYAHRNETKLGSAAIAALGGSCTISDPAPAHCLIPSGTPQMKSCDFDYGCSVIAPATCPAGSIVVGVSACETEKICFCPKCTLSGCKWNGCCKSIPVKFTAKCRKYRVVGTSNTCSKCMVGFALSSDKKSCKKYNMGTAMQAIAVQTSHQLSTQVVSGVSSAAIDAWQHTGIENAYSAAEGWSEDAVETMREASLEAVAEIENVIELIQQLLGQLECLEGLADLKKFANALRGQGTGMFDLVEDVLKGQESGESRTKYFNEMSGVACNMVWAMVFPQATVVVEIIKAFGERLKTSCPALKGGDLPAFTFGVVLGGDLTGGVQKVEAATEIGVGADLDGTRFCYVAACVGSGYSIPPKTGAEGSVGASIAVSGYKDIGTVAGTAGYFALDLGVDLPIVPAGIDIGVSYIHATSKPDQIYGISFSGQVSSASSDVNPAPWPSAGVTQGTCHTGICIRTDGEPCTSGQTYTPFGVAASSSSSSLGEDSMQQSSGDLGGFKLPKIKFKGSPAPAPAPAPPPEYDASALFTAPTAADIAAAQNAVNAVLPPEQKTQSQLYHENPNTYVPPSRVVGGKFLAAAGCEDDFKQVKLKCMETNGCIGFGQYKTTKKIFGVTLYTVQCWDLLQASTSATQSKYNRAQIRNYVLPDSGFAFLEKWGQSSSDDAEDRDAVREACWKRFDCIGYGQKSDRVWDLLTYGDTHTNTVYDRGIWKKYVNPAPGFKSVDPGNLDTKSFESFEEALDAKCQTDWKCLGYDYYFKFSSSFPPKLTMRKNLLYPGGKTPEDRWVLKYEHYYGVVVE